ncbi:hypothetical protein [Streptomyces sp. NPDC050535]|uniref:hypothetical protein n=1 Tax=Streptomyces sp. NPDC050535 TaxID=3365626 RepID=UPI0037878ADA
MDIRSGGDGPNQDQIAELRARADAGDRNAAGRLGELLAKRGDQEGALELWARTYGADSPTTKRLAELLAERGDLADAVTVWTFSDVVWQNPAGLHAEYLDTLDALDRLECEDDPEDWAFIEAEELAGLLAERGDEAALAELRARADAGDPAAAKRLTQPRM